MVFDFVAQVLHLLFEIEYPSLIVALILLHFFLKVIEFPVPLLTQTVHILVKLTHCLSLFLQLKLTFLELSLQEYYSIFIVGGLILLPINFPQTATNGLAFTVLLIFLYFLYA